MRWLLCGCLTALLSPLAGCGGGGGGAALPVSGIVTLDGKPVPAARVTFYPEKGTEGNGGAAETGTDGKFVIADSKGQPGLVAGKYRATVNKGQPNRPVSEESVGAVVEGVDIKDDFPAIYSDPSKTILSYSVTGDGKPIEIQLESKKK